MLEEVEMGCDIHDYVEVRERGWWAKVGAIFPCRYHDPNSPSDVRKCWVGGEFVVDGHADPKQCTGSCYVNNRTKSDHPYAGRNYNLFAILADVHNGYGFAGCDTGDPFVPIAPPRGLPDDVTQEVLKEYSLQVVDELDEEDRDGRCTMENAERWVRQGLSVWIEPLKVVSGPDWHSASWFTLAELEAYDWQQRTKHRGWVDPWNFELWRRNGKPEGWSGGVSGGSIEHVSNQAMARLIDSGDLQWSDGEGDKHGWGRPYTTSLQRSMQGWGLREGSVGAAMAEQGTKYYTLVEWEESYATSVGSFLSETLPRLGELGKPEDVRLVFWFDNYGGL